MHPTEIIDTARPKECRLQPFAVMCGRAGPSHQRWHLRPQGCIQSFDVRYVHLTNLHLCAVDNLLSTAEPSVDEAANRHDLRPNMLFDDLHHMQLGPHYQAGTAPVCLGDGRLVLGGEQASNRCSIWTIACDIPPREQYQKAVFD